jgi:hypothetical protein
MQHPDEGTIHAWLDGALQQEEGAALEAHVASCAECQAVVAEARGLIAASSRIVSALDIVPAGVIPARATPKRVWYAGPQFRAAAAILFVAGASMLIMRGRGSEPLADTAERVMSAAVQDSSPVSVQDGAMAETGMTAPPQEMPQAESRSRVAKAPAPKVAADEFTGAGVRQASTESDAAAAPPGAPPPVAPPPVAAATGNAAISAPLPDAKAAARRLRLNTSPALDNVVVTGVATGSTVDFADRLTVIGVDSTGSERITRYRLESGEEITLSEPRPALKSGISAQAERRAESSREMAAPAAPAPALVRTDSTAAAPMVTISWTDPKTSLRYTLSGRVSRERLEQLRKTMESTRR